MKVSELTGEALDWAVAKCEGATDEWDSDKPFFWHRVACIRIGGHDVNYTPSTSWLMGGPIIEREAVHLFQQESTSEWTASLPRDNKVGWRILRYGTTPLIAAMRCYVASKLGDDIEIPKELTV